MWPLISWALLQNKGVHQVKNYDFVITSHVRERFVERFSRESSKFGHLRDCRQTCCSVCLDLTYQLADLVKRNKSNWDSIICAKLHDAEEINVFHNSSVFMDKM